MLIVIVFLAILATLLLVTLKPQTQLQKSRDARRKADLVKLRTILEDYNNDKKSYPGSLVCGSSLDPYIDKIPCDPQTGTSYAYVKSATAYWIYAKLEYDKDKTIAEVGCASGCGPSCNYNYGVSSPNVGLEPCGPGGGCPGHWWACQGSGSPCSDVPSDPNYCGCNDLGTTEPSCLPGGTSYCDSSICGSGCAGQNPCIH